MVNLRFIYALTGVDVKADPIPISSEVALSGMAGIDLLGTTYGFVNYDSQSIKRIRRHCRGISRRRATPGRLKLQSFSDQLLRVCRGGQESAGWTSAAQAP
jgi:hypothetical protein